MQTLAAPQLARIAARVRCNIIQMIRDANAGHPGGSLSATDFVTALYFRVMNIDPQRPDWPDRDRFVLSKGHAGPVWYAALAERGYFDRKHLRTLRKLNSLLQGHPDMHKTPGVDMTVGSLGQGLCAGLGMALAARVNQRSYHVWVVVGDGEMQEGSVWEAAMAAAAFKLDNYTIILDLNRIQNDDFVEKVMPLGEVPGKWRAFGWRVLEIDGHDMEQIVQALESARAVKGQPTVIIANTIKGKGVSYMENNPAWHGRAPTVAEAQQALKEICDAAGLEEHDVAI